MISFGSALLTGSWSPLTTIGRKGVGDSVSNPYVCIVIFVCGEIIAIPFFLLYYGRGIIVLEQKIAPVLIKDYIYQLYTLPTKDKYMGLLTGTVLNIGYMFYFLSSQFHQVDFSLQIAEKGF